MKQTSGDIYLNKIHVDCSRKGDFDFLRKRIGFVLQEDLLFETETAGEAVEVSAKLRLNGTNYNNFNNNNNSNNNNNNRHYNKLDSENDDYFDDNNINNKPLSQEARIYRAEQVLQELDLWDSRNTKIGGNMIRGLSGGERKRVSIGIELVTDPNILFLDECTTGLDSAIAFQTMKLLKDLSQNNNNNKSGKTIICSLHQPSSEIFGLIDRVLILAKGKAVYHGYVNELPLYLSKHTGYECPNYTNVADFVLQLVHEQPDFFIDKWDEYMQNSGETSFIPQNDDFNSNNNKNNSSSSIAKIYRKQSRDYEDTIEKTLIAPICDQISILFKRQFLIFIRNPMPSYARLGQGIFTALLEGCLWWQMPPFKKDSPQLQTNIQNRFGGIFYAVTFSIMNAIMGATLTFPSQRLVFEKERSGNWYYTITFLLCKLFIDIPITLVMMFPFALIIRFMCNFHAEWYEIYFVLCLTASVADSMGFCMGCIAKTPETAMQLTPLTIMPLFLCSGFFIESDSIPVWLSWIQYVDCFYYGIDLWRIYEYEDALDSGVISHSEVNINTNHHMRDIYFLIGLFVGIRILGMLVLIARNGI